MFEVAEGDYRMRSKVKTNRAWQRALICLSLGVAATATGCQVDIGGQTLPSPFYQTDDIQYFPPGPEFKLSREAAAQKAFAEDRAAEQQ